MRMNSGRKYSRGEMESIMRMSVRSSMERGMALSACLGTGWGRPRLGSLSIRLCTIRRSRSQMGVGVIGRLLGCVLAICCCTGCWGRSAPGTPPTSCRQSWVTPSPPTTSTPQNPTCNSYPPPIPTLAITNSSSPVQP